MVAPNPEVRRQHYYDNKQPYLDRARQRKLDIRDFIRDAKKGPCVDCGVEYPYYVMQFDHRPDEVKLYDLSQMAKLGSFIKVREEIAKCDLVCANCHAERTHKRQALVV